MQEGGRAGQGKILPRPSCPVCCTARADELPHPTPHTPHTHHPTLPTCSVLRSDVSGRVVMKAFLSGMPDVKLGLNDKLEVCVGGGGWGYVCACACKSMWVWARVGGWLGVGCGRPSCTAFLVTPIRPAAPQAYPRHMQDVTFHPCVNLGRFTAEKVVSFVPPDGEFELMKYRCTGEGPGRVGSGFGAGFELTKCRGAWVRRGPGAAWMHVQPVACVVSGGGWRAAGGPALAGGRRGGGGGCPLPPFHTRPRPPSPPPAALLQRASTCPSRRWRC